MRTIHVRTSVPPESLAVQIQEQISELAPGLAVSEVRDMRHALQGANGFFFYSFGAQVTAVLGLLGLILAVVGIYSVVSYAAAQRTQEIGIRIAMGASPGDILKNGFAARTKRCRDRPGSWLGDFSCRHAPAQRPRRGRQTFRSGHVYCRSSPAHGNRALRMLDTRAPRYAHRSPHRLRHE